MKLGLMPPQAVEMEEVLLGALMLEPLHHDFVFNLLPQDAFYKEEHKIIYNACKNLFLKNEPIDIITVISELKKSGQAEKIGGAYFVSTLTNKVLSSAHADSHAKFIFQKFVYRQLINISNDIINRAYNEDVDCFELINRAEKALINIENNIPVDSSKSIGVVAVNELKEVKETILNKKPPGLPFNLSVLNTYTSGMHEGELIILAARPAMGKSAEALDILLNLSQLGYPCGIISLEMSNSQLMHRFFAKETKIPIHFIKSRQLDDYQIAEIEKAAIRYADLPIYLIDDFFSDIAGIKRLSKKLVKEKGVKCIVVDYLQQIEAKKEKGKSTDAEISEISRGLKMLAKELKIPIIALSQLSREVEKRQDKKPLLSDLRSSGSIEQDADVVIFLYRPEYYGNKEVEVNGLTYDSEGKAVFSIAKNRNGGTADFICKFKNNTTTFSDIEADVNYGSAMKPNLEF